MAPTPNTLRNDARLHSLAAGVMIDIAPDIAVRAAGEAGWPACGIWYDHDSWTPTRTSAVQRAVADYDVIALDIEPVIVNDGDDHGETIVEIGAAVGARFVLFTSRSDDWTKVVDRFGTVCDLAHQANLTVVCEFLPIFPLATLADAARVVAQAQRPNGAILVDSLHLRTTGASPADLAPFDQSLFPYVQLADAPLHAPESMRDRLNEALNERRWPGDGELPLNELLSAVGDVPVSYEVRSKHDRERWPDPVERAANALHSVVSWRQSARNHREQQSS
jgi:sugar phosphate isomerase/epimerase